MRTVVAHRHLLAALAVSALFLAGIICCPHRALAQDTGTVTIALVVQPGQVIQLVALGMPAPVVWTILEAAAGGAVATDGRYMAPTAAGTYHIIASSKAAPNRPCVFTVTVRSGAPMTGTSTTETPATEPPMGAERLYPLPGGGVMRMRYVPAGAFAMGNSGQGDDAALGTDDERPRHTVTLPGFWIGKSEVTRGKYRLFMQAGGYSKREYWSPEGWTWCKEVGRVQPDNWDVETQWADPPGMFKQTEDHPVIGVNYFEAEAFCRWAGLRLPTEAEWEKAARWDGERSRIYPWGDAWDANGCNDAFDPSYFGAQTAPVGKYLDGASPCGALDMAGNAWEWALDWYDPEYFAASPGTNPQGPDTSDRRIIKGGCWFGSNFVGAGEDDRLRCAQRTGFGPFNSDGRIGFRCVVTTMPASAK